MKKSIFEILNELGVPCGIKGRQYLEYAVEYVFNQGLVSITKVLYPHIGEVFNTTDKRVERAIRFAIERTFLNCPIETLSKYFGNTSSVSKSKLTNSDFIYGLAKYLKVFVVDET